MTRAIVYLPNQSRYDFRVDNFRRETGRFNDRLVWGGESMSIEEFNAEFPKIIKDAHFKWGIEPLVELFEESKSKKNAPVKVARAVPISSKAGQQPSPETEPVKEQAAAVVEPSAEESAAKPVTKSASKPKGGKKKPKPEPAPAPEQVAAEVPPPPPNPFRPRGPRAHRMIQC